MNLSLITNKPDRALLAEDAGIDRIFIDLERLGKAKRQNGRHLFLSDHSLQDLARMRQVICKANLMVRIDPLHPDSGSQIEAVLDSGADVIMLPYFHQLSEAQEFIDLVGCRAATVLLVETPGAASILSELSKLDGLSEIHVGLNDLSIGLGKNVLFDLVIDGTIDLLCASLRSTGLPFGFGGIACLDRDDLPISPELFLAFQICLGARCGWLGRTFRDTQPALLPSRISALRQAIAKWTHADQMEQHEVRQQLFQQIRLLNH